jgi:hypothetical protein
VKTRSSTRARNLGGDGVDHSAAVLTGLEHNSGRWLQSQTTHLFCRHVCALRASASELVGDDQRCGGAMSALSLYRCMHRFLQLCSGLEHNHQKVDAGRSVLSLGRGRALRVSANELAGVEQSCGGTMSALSLYRLWGCPRSWCCFWSATCRQSILSAGTDLRCWSPEILPHACELRRCIPLGEPRKTLQERQRCGCSTAVPDTCHPSLRGGKW